MQRRKFIELASLGLLNAGIPFYYRFDRPENDINEGRLGKTTRLDKYGGLKSLRFEGSGYFRLEKKDRWWFVTPEGSAFLSFGLNHPDVEYMLQDYNREFWRKKFGFTEKMDEVLRKKFIGKVMADLEYFGMNTIGTHAKKEYFGQPTVPYVQGLYFVGTSYWRGPVITDFPDVYSPSFNGRCDRIAQRVVGPKRCDPFLLGYTLTDCPVLTDRDSAAHGQDPWGGPAPEAPTWPRVLRNLGSDAPGKHAFISIIRKRYTEIIDFNKIYQTQFSSFDSLLAAEKWSSYMKVQEVDDEADNHAFLIDILQRYYTIACSTIHKYDPNHLIFGDIINAQTPRPDEIISLMTKYSDLIAYQFYGGYDEQVHLLNKWSALSGKPLFHADSSFSVPYKEMPNPIGAVCPDTETRANRFLDFATKAFQRPDFIGWNWCGWMDAWEEWKPVRQHTGLQDPFGNYHHPMPEAMKWFGSRLYRFGRKKNIPVIPVY